MKTYPVGLAGETNYQRAIRASRVGEIVELLPEPHNPFDNRAVAAICPRGKTLGYLPRGSWLTGVVIDEDAETFAMIKSIDRGSGQALGVVLDVAIKGAAPVARAAVSAAPPRAAYSNPDAEEMRQPPWADASSLRWAARALGVLGLVWLLYVLARAAG